MIVKVCGMREPENIRATEHCDIDMMGFIFAPHSPRCVSRVPADMPDSVLRIGVFVDAALQEIIDRIAEYGLHGVQLHGSEPPALCAELKSRGLKVLKAFQVKDRESLTVCRLYEGVCDYFLFDTPSAAGGGSGRKFDWNLLQHYRGTVPFLLSGGLSPDSLAALRTFSHPKWAGIDLNSGFETAPGLKDVYRLQMFVKQFRDEIKRHTMNRINRLFQEKKKEILSLYFCAGHPTFDGTRHVIKTLQSKGVDMIEIGIPFSDPMADGPVIQEAATCALRNGMTLKKLFGQLAGIRNEVQIPLVLMGYLNPILQYGFEAFCRSCAECGIDGVIIPDLPFREYREHYKATAERYDLRIIMLITPETSEERIRLIDEHTDGFIYMVSSAAITGAQKDFNAQKLAYFKRIESLQLRNPRMIGFGISNRQTHEAACSHAAGAIIGSKFVTLLQEEGDPSRAVDRLLQALGE